MINLNSPGNNKVYLKQNTSQQVRDIYKLDSKMQGETKIYDIVVVTRSRGGFNAMQWIAEKLQQVTTENMTPQAIFGAGIMKPIDEYFV